MPGKPDADDWRVERGGQIQFQSSIQSQAQVWWHGVGENASESSSSDQKNDGSVMTSAIDNEGLADRVDYNKQCQHLISPSLFGTDRDVAEHHQSIKHVLSSTPLFNGKQPGPDSQMEPVSRPIVLTSYPYPDARYGGILTAYVQQAMPYIHESRHLHAMRRARGCGGCFLNAKKHEGDNYSANAQEEGNNTGASSNPSKTSGSSSAAELFFTDNENLGSSNGHPDAPDS